MATDHESDSTPQPLAKRRGSRFYVRRAALALLLVLVSLPVLGAVYEWISTARDSNQYSEPGRLVSVGDHQLHAVVSGEGSPAVILEAGAGGTSLDWVNVQPELAAFCTTVSYDRAGLGWSELGPEPRSSEHIVAELHAMLDALDVDPPYVLVGHSFGGLNVRLFAATYPKDVAGLVLVDAIHEDFYARMPPEMGQAAEAQLGMLKWGRLLKRFGLPRLLFPPLATRGLPDDAQGMADALGRRYETFKTVYDEALAFEESANSVRDAAPLPNDLPLAVLSRTQPEPWPPSIPAETAEKTWAELQRDLADLSSNVQHDEVADTGHFIAIKRPAAVVNAVHGIVEQMRLRSG